MKVKLKAMERNSTPSDDEIRKHMNFEKLAEDARRISESRTSRKWWLALSAIVATLGLWFMIESFESGTPTVMQESRGEHAVYKQRELSPNDSSSVERAEEERDHNELSSEKGLPKVEHNARGEREADAAMRRSRELADRDSSPIQGSGKEGASGATLASRRGEPGDTYIQAAPQQGYDHLYAYFREHLSYPEDAVKDSIEGVETVSFVIDEKGKPSQVVVTQSLGAAFDEEALRTINNMPPWSPAMLNGRPVASQLSVPLTFELKRIRR